MRRFTSIDGCGSVYFTQASHCIEKTGKIAQKNACEGNTGNLEILPKHRENTGNLVCSNYKFPDSKGKRYFEICRENL